MADFDLAALLAERPLRFGEDSATGRDTFDYAPGQPNLFLLSRFKLLLVKERGLEAGFDIYRRSIVKQKASALEARRLASHRDYSKAHAVHFHESIPAGEPFTIPPPRVIGEGNHRPLHNVTRSFYVSCLEDARVRGRSSIVEVADAALADFQDDELARIDDEVEFDSAVFRRDGGAVWMMRQDEAALEFDVAFSLLGCRTDFFGDWFGDSIARYVAATLGGHLPPAPILIDAHMPRTHRQALEMMLAPGAPIIEIPAFRTVHVRRLWSAPGLNYMPFHQKLNERFKWDYVASSPRHTLPIDYEMMRRADRAIGGERGPSRVFVARKDFRHRKLVNREKIEAIAEARGFVIAYPEELDFAGQVRLLRGARYVVGPEGSALFLCLFMGRGAKLCILNHRETVGLAVYNAGAEEKGVEVTVISGPEAGERHGRSQDMNYVIDPEVFRRFLDGWLDEATPVGARR